MDVNQVRFGEYSIGNPRMGAKKNDEKAEDNKTSNSNSQNEKSVVNPENVLNAMNIAGLQNKAQINISQREVNPIDFLSEDRINDIEAMMAEFENGVNSIVNVIEAEFPNAFTDQQKHSLAAMVYARE